MTFAASLNDSRRSMGDPSSDSDNCSSNDSGPGGRQSALVISKDVMFSGLSAIIPAGLVLNALSLLVLMSRPMRRRASSWYLAALAVSDSLSLVAVSFDYWLKDSRIGLQVMRNSAMACVTVSHLSYASRLLSSWLVTTFTIERFIGVFYPLRRSLIISVSHARRVILAETVACTVLAGFAPFTIGIVDHGPGSGLPDCDILPDKAHIYVVFNVAFVIVGSIVAPVLIIVTLNTAIFRRIRHRASHRRDFDATSSEEHQPGQSPPDVTPARYHHTLSLYHHRHHHNDQEELRGAGRSQSAAAGNGRQRDHNVTYLLLVVSSTFVVLNVPYCICWLTLFFYHINLDPATSSCAARRFDNSLLAAKYIATVPYCLNYGVNFALYSVCARAFRDQLVRILSTAPFCRCFCRVPPGHTELDLAHVARRLQPPVITPRAPRLRHAVVHRQQLQHLVRRQSMNEQPPHCQCHLPDFQ